MNLRANIDNDFIRRYCRQQYVGFTLHSYLKNANNFTDHKAARLNQICDQLRLIASLSYPFQKIVSKIRRMSGTGLP